MTRFWATLSGSVLALVLLAGAHARADFIDYNYNWERTPSTGVLPAGGSGTGGVTLTDEPGVTATGSTDVVATELRTFSSADPHSPDTLTNAKYTLTVTITDATSGVAGSITFGGELNGNFSKKSSNITNTFLDSHGNPAPSLSGTLVLGDSVHGFNTYKIVLDEYVHPGNPSATNAGSIGGHIDVTAGDTGGHTGGGNPPPVGSPEPSTLALSFLGLSGIGFASWRRWKNRRHSPLALA